MTRLFLGIIICFLASSLFNDRPLQHVEIENRDQSIQNVINQI